MLRVFRPEAGEERHTFFDLGRIAMSFVFPEIQGFDIILNR